MAAETDRPIPKPDTFVPTEAFWAAAGERKLKLQFCRDKGRFQHYPRPVSIYTGSRNLEWREVSGRGRIYACTVLRVPGPGLTGRVPLVVATVELEEGVRIIGNILGSSPADVRIGMPVVLTWDPLGPGAAYPAFRLAG